MYKNISNAVRIIMTRKSEGFAVSQIGIHNLGKWIDPVINIDLFEMSQPTFPPHPHAGFSAVTYMLESSKGSFQNRDSRGDSSIISPGDIHWTLAGSGIVHEEVPTVSGISCSGLQIFVNLPSIDKEIEPKGLHLKTEEMPTITNQYYRAKIVSGEWQGKKSPLPSYPNILILDITLKTGEITIELPEENSSFLLSLSGKGIILQNEGEVSLEENFAICFQQEKGKITIKNDLAEDLKLILFSGVPIKEPLFPIGPFIMNTEADGHRKYSEYKQGKMGSIPT
ncbi:MAG: pirin family protein [Leptospiraceae bacterium]|nr:pirin family protein [Leptospiraceae bacterium]